MIKRPRRQGLSRKKLGFAAIHALAVLRGRRAAPSRWPLLGEGVAKQKCGSCHFFQEAGLAGSGWCHHPQRKVSSGVLIMVRRNELACRDEWSRSLWQPSTGQQSNTDVAFQRPAASGPLPPALPENLRSVLNRDMTIAASSEGEDVLLSEARIVSEAHESWSPPERPFPAVNFDPRTAIFRAREAYRERVRAKAVADRHAAGAEAIGGVQSAEDIAQPEPDATATGGGDLLPDAADELSAMGEARVQTPETHGWPDDQVTTETPGASPEFTAVQTLNGQGASIGRRGNAGASNSRDSGAILSPPQSSAEPPDKAAAATRAPEEAVVAIRLEKTAEEERLPDWFRADLPRICRACRDYRPSADGQRGWCANAWAFTHRRLVHEDDVAPCHSTIGDWWAPVDDVWLVAADVSSHGRATPLLDRTTANTDPQRRRS